MSISTLPKAPEDVGGPYSTFENAVTIDEIIRQRHAVATHGLWHAQQRHSVSDLEGAFVSVDLSQLSSLTLPIQHFRHHDPGPQVIKEMFRLVMANQAVQRVNKDLRQRLAAERRKSAILLARVAALEASLAAAPQSDPPHTDEEDIDPFIPGETRRIRLHLRNVSASDGRPAPDGAP